ncbi:hypothetical protein A0256_13095 [Mucilaginibacter sp. PAMC 26640]|nr:hypothetical protein A0256_13095 [Mucilaginibacter sp. PAMC 26640]
MAVHIISYTAIRGLNGQLVKKIIIGLYDSMYKHIKNCKHPNKFVNKYFKLKSVLNTLTIMKQDFIMYIHIKINIKLTIIVYKLNHAI